MSRGGSRGPAAKAYEALQDLMAQPGDISEIWADAIFNTSSLLGGALIAPDYDDRAAALVYGAMVEQALEGAIATHFTSREFAAQIFSYNQDGALATFSAKIALGYALGIYDERLRRTLKWIKNIRNAFAHVRVKIDFSTPAIVEACNQFEIIEVREELADKISEPLSIFLFGKPVPPPASPRLLAARDLYVVHAALTANYLTSANDKPLFFKDSAVYENLYSDDDETPT